MDKPRKSGAAPNIADANVRRLRELQKAADIAFSTHVSRHKAEIDRLHGYFKEKYPLLGFDIRTENRRTEETGPDHMEEMAGDIYEEPLVMAEDEESEIKKTTSPPPEFEPATDKKPVIDWRALQQKRRTRALKRQKYAPRLHIKPAMPKPLTPEKQYPAPEPAATPTSTETEEERVLEEIAKFEAMLKSRHRRPVAEPAPQPPPIPPSHAATVTPKRRGFSLKNLFDLKPQFRNVDANDSDKTDS